MGWLDPEVGLDLQRVRFTPQVDTAIFYGLGEVEGEPMSVVGLRTGAGSFDERASPRAARRRFGVFAVLLVALALMAAPARADFAAGVAAYDAGNYNRAYAEFLPLARWGDAAA